MLKYTIKMHFNSIVAMENANKYYIGQTMKLFSER